MALEVGSADSLMLCIGALPPISRCWLRLETVRAEDYGGKSDSYLIITSNAILVRTGNQYPVPFNVYEDYPRINGRK